MSNAISSITPLYLYIGDTGNSRDIIFIENKK